eukprot:COSAG05_NODE_689_length_7904_cov_97.607816_5_plen_131_part_00
MISEHDLARNGAGVDKALEVTTDAFVPAAGTVLAVVQDKGVNSPCSTATATEASEDHVLSTVHLARAGTAALQEGGRRAQQREPRPLHSRPGLHDRGYHTLQSTHRAHGMGQVRVRLHALILDIQIQFES